MRKTNWKKRKLPSSLQAKNLPQGKSAKDISQDKQIQQLKLMVNRNKPPVKSIYTNVGSSVSDSFTGFPFAYPAKGGLSTERLADEIFIKSIQLNYLVTVDNTDTYDTFRVVIVQLLDGNPTGNYPTGIVSPNLFITAATTSYPWLAPYNTQKKASYRVLYDKMHHLNENGSAEQSAQVLILPSQLAVKKIVFVDDTGGQLPPLEEGLIACFAISNSDSVPHPSFEGVWRLNFTDS